MSVTYEHVQSFFYSKRLRKDFEVLGGIGKDKLEYGMLIRAQWA